MIGDARDDLFLVDWGQAGALVYRPRSDWVRLLRGAELQRLLRGRRHPRHNAPRIAEAPAPFRPNCLTLWLGGACPLRCTYCFVRDTRAPQAGVVPPEEALGAAAEVVAQGARRAGRPFVLTLHGGCEPLGVLAAAEPAVEVARRVAARWGLRLQIHATTGGAVPPAALQWAAAHLHTVTLSWDGGAEIHDRQRPRRDGTGSHSGLMRALSSFAAAGLSLRVRATVTEPSLAGLPAAVEELVRHLDPAALHRTVLQPEPVFAGEPGLPAPVPAPPAEAFTRVYLRLLRALQPSGLRLELAGCRPNGAAHGRHCAFWQHNLVLDPGGRAVGCLLPSMAARTCYSGTGERRSDSAGWGIESLALQDLRQVTRQEPARCAGCFVRERCARGCPTLCPVISSAAPDEERCLRNRRVGFAHLLQRAQGGLSEADADAIMARVGMPPDERLDPAGGSWP